MNVLRVEVQRLNVAKREAEARAAANEVRWTLSIVACPVYDASSAKVTDLLTCHSW